jgi:hypothetical protein
MLPSRSNLWVSGAALAALALLLDLYATQMLARYALADRASAGAAGQAGAEQAGGRALALFPGFELLFVAAGLMALRELGPTWQALRVLVFLSVGFPLAAISRGDGLGGGALKTAMMVGA